MTERAHLDVQWKRERRRVGIRSGLVFAVIGIVLRLAQQAGMLETLGFGGGPFTLRWGAAVLGGAMVGAVVFGYAMQWTVKPPERAWIP